MSSLVRTMYRESEFGVETELAPAGTALENPYVYDSAARELHVMAEEGLVKIVQERVVGNGASPLIKRISFERLR